MSSVSARGLAVVGLTLLTILGPAIHTCSAADSQFIPLSFPQGTDLAVGG